jgi:hypothetical protein
MTTTNDRPDLSSEGTPDIGKTVNIKPKLMSGHETKMGLESRTYWPTDRRSLRDFDFGLMNAKNRGQFHISFTVNPSNNIFCQTS